MKRYVFGFAVLIAGAAYAGHEFEGQDIKAGSVIYADNCASCHGVNLEGQPDWRSPDENGVLPAPPHNETGHTWHHDNMLLFEYTKFGGQNALAKRGVSGFKSGMPEFGTVLSDEEIWQVLAFIQSTWPKPVQAAQKLRNPPHN